MARGLDVQSQNKQIKENCLREARYWREHGLPDVLAQVCQERGIDTEHAVFFDVGGSFDNNSFHEAEYLYGWIMHGHEQIVYFEIELADDGSPLVAQWRDAAADFNFCRHNKGFGKGLGAILQEVWVEMNGTQAA